MRFMILLQSGQEISKIINSNRSSFPLSKSLSTCSWDLSSMSCLRFDDLLSVCIKITISWKSMPRCLTDRKQCLRRACCRHLQGRRSLYPEERNSWFFRNSGKYLRNFRALYSRKNLIQISSLSYFTVWIRKNLFK